MTKTTQNNSLEDLSGVMSLHEKQSSDYLSFIANLTQADIAYFVEAYAIKNTMQRFWPVDIFNNLAKNNKVPPVESFKQISDLAATSNFYSEEKEKYPEFRYPKIPVYFLCYIQNYWLEAIVKLRSEWKPDALNLSMMAIRHKEESMYQDAWVSNLLRFFYDKDLPVNFLKTLQQAQQQIADGKPVDWEQHEKFHQLTTISLSEYRTRMLMKSIVDDAIKGMYVDNKKTAEEKLIRSRKAKTQEARNKIFVSLSLLEVEALLAKDQDEYKKNIKKHRIQL